MVRSVGFLVIVRDGGARVVKFDVVRVGLLG